MVQNINFSGILNAFRLIASPSLAMPHIIVNDIREIPMESLKKHGIKAMAYDKDNCLTVPYVSTIHPPFKAQALEQSLGVHVLRHTQKKPSGGDALTNNLQIPHAQIAFVGDRVLTDVMYGNLNGNLTIWSKQVITEKGDNKPAILIRRMEHQLIKMLHHLDIKPSPHPFYTNKSKD